MTKTELTARTDAAYNQTHDALATVWEALPPGQRNVLSRKPEVKAVLVRYGVTEEESE